MEYFPEMLLREPNTALVTRVEFEVELDFSGVEF